MPAPARVYLRPPAAADEAPFLAHVDASRALHAAWVGVPNTPALFRQYVSRAAMGVPPYPAHLCRLVCRTSDDAIVGVANVNNILWGGLCSGALGYYGFAHGAGHGYVRAGVARLLTTAFREFGLHRVEACIQPDNAASRALVAALGFRHEGHSPRFLKLGGRWRDHDRWAITAEEWRPPRRGATKRSGSRSAE